MGNIASAGSNKAARVLSVFIVLEPSVPDTISESSAALRVVIPRRAWVYISFVVAWLSVASG